MDGQAVTVGCDVCGRPVAELYRRGAPAGTLAALPERWYRVMADRVTVGTWTKRRAGRRVAVYSSGKGHHDARPPAGGRRTLADVFRDLGTGRQRFVCVDRGHRREIPVSEARYSAVYAAAVSAGRRRVSLGELERGDLDGWARIGHETREDR
jgi:hypothetical protein